MSRLVDLFSVNCCFLTTVVVLIAIGIGLTWPSPNQAIISACQRKQYRQIHLLVETELQRIEEERRRESQTRGTEFVKPQIDDIQFGSGRSALHVAAMHGDVPILKYFRKRGASLIDAPKDDDGRIPLHFAATFGTPETVKLLIDWGSNVNARAQYGWTPLLKAVLLSNHDIVEVLLTHGADPNLAVDGSFNSLQCAMIYSDDRMIYLLLKHGGYVEEGENWYELYMTHRNTVIRMELLKEEELDQRRLKLTPNNDDDDDVEKTFESSTVEVSDSDKDDRLDATFE